MIFEVKIAVFAIQNFLPKGLGLQCSTTADLYEDLLAEASSVRGLQ